MTRRRALALLVLTAGAWQAGTGLYIPAKALIAQQLLQHAWARTLAGERAARPWPWADTWPLARLRVPTRDLDVIVLAGASGRTLAFGPGHLAGSPLPGDAGNSIIAGHRDTHFRFLRTLQPGDVLEVQRGDGRELAFRVDAVTVVDSRSGRLRLDTDDSALTLVTCYPFDAVVPGGPLRLAVTARLVFGDRQAGAGRRGGSSTSTG